MHHIKSFLAELFRQPVHFPDQQAFLHRATSVFDAERRNRALERSGLSPLLRIQ